MTPPTSTVYHTNSSDQKTEQTKATYVYKQVTELWGRATYHATFSKWTRLLHNHNHSTTKPQKKNTPSYNKTIANLKN